MSAHLLFHLPELLLDLHIESAGGVTSGSTASLPDGFSNVESSSAITWQRT